jgi:hypothetical protein
MGTAWRFGITLAKWSAAFALLLLAERLLVSLVRTDTGGIGTVPHWLPFALAICAFPAGVAVADEVVPADYSFRPGRIAGLTLAAVAAGALAFALAAELAPAALRMTRDERLMTGPHERVEMSLAELTREADRAMTEATAGGIGEAAAGGVLQWLRANELAWELRRRAGVALLVPMMAWLGALVAVWSRWTPRVEVRRVQQCAAALCLLVGIYGMAENSFEMIVLRMAGPAEFAGWLKLTVPACFLIGLAVPTAAKILERDWGAEAAEYDRA